jgi:selenocysteine lyase/cysteine desulfurase
MLSRKGAIGVRNGCFCAQPYVHKLLGITLEDIEKMKNNKELPRPGMVRISFGMYNDYEEIDIFLDLLRRV